MTETKELVERIREALIATRYSNEQPSLAKAHLGRDALAALSELEERLENAIINRDYHADQEHNFSVALDATIKRAETAEWAMVENMQMRQEAELEIVKLREALRRIAEWDGYPEQIARAALGRDIEKVKWGPDHPSYDEMGQ